MVYTLPQASSRVWVLHFDTMFFLWSDMIMLCVHLQPNPIIAQDSIIVTLCNFSCDIHYYNSWKIESHYSLTHSLSEKCHIFVLIGHICTLKTIIKSIPLYRFKFIPPLIFSSRIELNFLLSSQLFLSFSFISTFHPMMKCWDERFLCCFH